MHRQLAGDVDDAEEAEMRRVEGGLPPHATPGNDFRTPATGAAPGGGQGCGSSPGGEGHQGPPPFPHDQVAAEGAGAAAAAAGVDAGAGVDADDHPPPPREVAPRPATFPENRRGLIEDQAANIKTQYEGRRGMSTYITSWKLYENYHIARYGVPAPHCPFTDLLWLTQAQGVHFISYMARNKKSSSQASPPPFVLAYSCYLQEEYGGYQRDGWVLPPHLRLTLLCFPSLLSDLICKECVELSFDRMAFHIQNW